MTVRQTGFPGAVQADLPADERRQSNADCNSLELDQQSQTQLQFRRAMDTAMRMLALREHSASELNRKLCGKGHSAETAADVLAELQALDLQSDVRFTDSFLRSRLARGQGPLRIRYDLAQKGISETLLEEALTQPAEFWLEVAAQARSRRFGDDLPGGDTAAWNAQARFLSRRGFPSDMIYRTLGSRY